MNEKRQDDYVPALGHDWLTPLYDVFIRWTIRESFIKGELIDQAKIEAGHRVLDLGCGTATLTLLVKRTHPGAGVVGLDGDPRILQIARSKALREGLEVTFDLGMAFELPYPDRSFDRVLSSLMIHHLTAENKHHAAREVFRVLRPGGEFHVVDFGKPRSAAMRAIAFFVSRGHGAERMVDNLNGRLPGFFTAAGFLDAKETRQFTTVYGTLSFYQAKKPD